MTMVKKVESRELFMGKLSHGSDVLEELTAVCRRENIRLGRVEALGAVQRARLGFYDQEKRAYRYLELAQHLEITSLVGNVSLKDGQPMVHAHVTLADGEGKAYGGHLASGTVVFACEFVLEAFEGPTLERVPDETTGLPLWPLAD